MTEAFEVTERVLGEGGFARVVQGRHRRTGWPVAVKLLRPDVPSVVQEAAGVEARALARLDHPGVVRIYDTIEHGGQLAIVMERASATAASAPPTDWEALLALLMSLLDALSHVHAAGLLHRDVKPSNLLLGCRREPREPLVHPIDGFRLADFGIAARAGLPPQLDGVGSVGFAAPEQVGQRRRDLGPWTDLYAVGRVAELLAGRLPSIPQQLLEWSAWLTADDPRDRPDRARWAAEGLLTVGGPEHPAPRSTTALGQGSTLLHLVRVDAPARPAATTWRPPPPPHGTDDWRTALAPWPVVELVDAGLGLQHLRPFPFVDREAPFDAVWAELQACLAGEGPRWVQLVGGPGSGRRRLLREVAARAHAVGAADVVLVRAGAAAEDGFPERRSGRRVVLVGLLDALAPHELSAWTARADDRLLVVAARGSLPDATRVPLPPMHPDALRGLLAGGLRLTLGLTESLVAHAEGVPGRIAEWLVQWSAEEALVPTRYGFTHRLGDRPPPLGVREAGQDPVEQWRQLQPRLGSRTLDVPALQRGLEVLDALGAGPDDPRRLALEVRREVLLGSSLPGYEARLEELEARSANVDVPELRDQLTNRLARRVGGEAAEQRLREARERAVSRSDFAGMVEADAFLANVLADEGRLREAEAPARRAVALAWTRPEDPALGYASRTLARVQETRGDLPGAERTCRDALPHLDNQVARSHLSQQLGLILWAAGRYGEAIDVLEGEVAVEGNPQMRGMARTNLGWLCVEAERYEAAEVHLRAALRDYARSGSDDALPRLGLAVAAAWRGRLDQVRALLPALRADPGQHGSWVALFGALLEAWLAVEDADPSAWPDGLSERMVGQEEEVPVITLVRHLVAVGGPRGLQVHPLVAWLEGVDARG